MPLLDDATREDVRRRFADLKAPVNLVLFKDPSASSSSDEIAELLTELAGLSPKVTLEEHEAGAASASLALRYAIARTPAIVVESDRDWGIRYYGAPNGYEFGSLLEVMVDIARGEVDLAPAIRAGLATLRDPVHIQVFTTPT